MLPDWDSTNTSPAGRSGSAKIALAVSRRSRRRSTRPRLLGPSTRTLPGPAALSNAARRAVATVPVPAKPSLSTVATGMPRSAHSVTTPATLSAPTMMNA